MRPPEVRVVFAIAVVIIVTAGSVARGDKVCGPWCQSLSRGNAGGLLNEELVERFTISDFGALASGSSGGGVHPLRIHTDPDGHSLVLGWARGGAGASVRVLAPGSAALMSQDPPVRFGPPIPLSHEQATVVVPLPLGALGGITLLGALGAWRSAARRRSPAG